MLTDGHSIVYFCDHKWLSVEWFLSLWTVKVVIVDLILIYHPWHSSFKIYNILLQK